MSGKISFTDLIKALKTKRMLTVFLLGFSSGLPIMLIYGSIKLWLRREGVDLKTIGYISALAIPYSYNFLWAFLLDRYKLFRIGKRRSWLLLTQLGIIGSLVLLSFGNPSESVKYIAVIGTILCFWSASHDVAVDAYRNEILTKEELGVGASLGVYGYRISMWVASGFGIWITDQETWNFSFNQMFLLMAAFMSVGVFATLLADEPEQKEAPLKNLKDSVILPFTEFLKRPGSIILLLFIFLYKFGDSFAGSMSRAFYADIGFSNKLIGEIPSTVGFFSTMLGLFLGGSIIFKFGYFRSLLVSGVLQMISTAIFASLVFSQSIPLFSFVVFFEDLSSGMGTAALVAFMGSLANHRFTATQYALFASLASLGRTVFASFAGNIIEFFKASPLIFTGAEHSGYLHFYLLGSLMAVPGIILLLFAKDSLNKNPI